MLSLFSQVHSIEVQCPDQEYPKQEEKSLPPPKSWPFVSLGEVFLGMSLACTASLLLPVSSWLWFCGSLWGTPRHLVKATTGSQPCPAHLPPPKLPLPYSINHSHTATLHPPTTDHIWVRPTVAVATVCCNSWLWSRHSRPGNQEEPWDDHCWELLQPFPGSSLTQWLSVESGWEPSSPFPWDGHSPRLEPRATGPGSLPCPECPGLFVGLLALGTLSSAFLARNLTWHLLMKPISWTFSMLVLLSVWVTFLLVSATAPRARSWRQRFTDLGLPVLGS